jgi:hypothetical protein
MTAFPSETSLKSETFQIVVCPHCGVKFKFFRTSSPHMDECGFESYELKCEGCNTPLRGIIDPADDKLLLSEVPFDVS